eukprot:Nk52_evm1s2583 gene=Nk52_evmTU1s2583
MTVSLLNAGRRVLFPLRQYTALGSIHLSSCPSSSSSLSLICSSSKRGLHHASSTPLLVPSCAAASSVGRHTARFFSSSSGVSEGQGEVNGDWLRRALVRRGDIQATGGEWIVGRAQEVRLGDQKVAAISATGAGAEGKEEEDAFVLVDVREPNELEELGMIPSAANCPLSHFSDFFGSEDLMDPRLNPLNPQNTEVIFYCKAGIRAQQAADYAYANGWK